MKKSTRIVKRLIALSLVLLLSIESFAAVVGDNDGAAFITKAEFDSMKNDFQSQLDRYNSSIDNKIDGAIASYLAGISVGRKIEIKPMVSNYQDMLWKRMFQVYGSYNKFVNKVKNEEHINEWYLPVIQDFLCMRRANYQVSMLKIRDSGGSVTTVWGDWELSRGRFVMIQDSMYLPRFQLQCDPDSLDEIQLGEFPGWAVPSAVASNTVHGQKILINKGNSVGRSYAQQEHEDILMQWNGSSWAVQYGGIQTHSSPLAPLLNSDRTVHWIEDMGSDGDEILDWRVAYNASNDRSIYVSNRFTLNSNHVAALQYWSAASMEEIDLSYWADNLIANMSVSDHFWDEPLYIQVCDPDSAIQQSEDLKYLMLGKGFDYTTAIERINPSVAVEGYYRVDTTYAQFVDLKLNVNKLAVGATNPWTKDGYTNVTYNQSVPMTWRVPLQEKYDFKEITSGLFKNGNENLKFGQGLPISTSLVENGKLTIEFDYSIGRTAGTVPETATGIEVDLRTNDYLTADGDYYNGYLNNNTTRAPAPRVIFRLSSR